MDPSKLGIYVNPSEGKIVRITSPYWIPEGPDWVLVTNNPNATLVAARDMIKEKGLITDPSEVVWTRLPLKE